MVIRWLEDVRADDTAIVGGKGASLGELTDAGLPVPPGFVVSVDAYESFVEDSGIEGELFEALDVDPDESAALASATEQAQSLVEDAPVPDRVREEVLGAYDELGDEPFVAVRSSATAEDLPDASFAGQQETFLNVTREDLIDRVRSCWASLFTERAIAYRERQGFDHEAVEMAVVVQRMIDADTSGVMFTRDPSTGEETTVVEAAWGLGEGVVSGTVSPDNYVVAPDDSVADVTVAEKKTEYVKDSETGETVEREVPDDRRNARVLDDGTLAELAALGRDVEDHYGTPQDVEWAMLDGEVYILQSRPITTIDENVAAAAAPDDDEDADGRSTADGATTGRATADGSGAELDDADATANGAADGEPLVSGLGASPGVVAGPARIVEQLDELDKVRDGDVIVTPMTTPDMVPAMKRAAAIVTEEGGLTSHAAIVSRELGVPAVTGTGDATDVLDDGLTVEVDGDRGTVSEEGTSGRAGAGAGGAGDGADDATDVSPRAPVKPMTATEVKVNVSLPDAAERAASTGADGVGLLRLEHMILEMGTVPAKYIADRGADEYVSELVDGIRTVADAFYPRPVRVRTLDAPTDEFRGMDGGEDEPVEHNPMLGFRGIRRSLAEPDVFEHELAAFRQLYDMGYDNVELMFPLVNDADDAVRLLGAMENAGIDPDRRTWGVMIETPASALSIEELVDAGIDFASFGTNDLTQYTLAVDRNNERVADRYEATHPAVKSLIADVIETCREHDVRTSICGEAGSTPEMVRFLVNEGVTSISANIDAVRDVQHEVKRVEQRLLLDSVR